MLKISCGATAGLLRKMAQVTLPTEPTLQHKMLPHVTIYRLPGLLTSSLPLKWEVSTFNVTYEHLQERLKGGTITATAGLSAGDPESSWLQRLSAWRTWSTIRAHGRLSPLYGLMEPAGRCCALQHCEHEARFLPQRGRASTHPPAPNGQEP